jgi:hypothetical protein
VSSQPLESTPLAAPPPLTEAELAAMPWVVQAQPGTRLEQLADQYERLKDQADASAAELKETTEAIKAELAAAAPGRTNVLLESPLLSLPLRMLGYVSRRMDTKALKKDYPQVYRDYSSPSTTWKLERLKP